MDHTLDDDFTRSFSRGEANGSSPETDSESSTAETAI